MQKLWRNMGCDIHVVQEIYIPGLKKWVGVQSYNSYLNKDLEWVFHPIRERNYSLFTALAGVRGPGPEPKGPPPDMSDLAQVILNNWTHDAHSITWYSAEEFFVLFYKHACTEDMQNRIAKDRLNGDDSELIPMMLAAHHGHEARFIIWFDN